MMKATAILVALSLILSCTRLFTQPGMVDMDFGNQGLVTTPVRPSGDDEGQDVVVLSNGKTMIAGTAWNGWNLDFFLTRLLPDGTPDTSFGEGGTVLTDFGESFDYVSRMALQDDGGVILAGYTISPFPPYNATNIALARYLPDGMPDLGFGIMGKVVTDINGQANYGEDVVIQSDGKILVAARHNVGNYARLTVLRYMPNGVLDPDFGNAGVLTLHWSGFVNEVSYACALQADGKILVGGEISNAGTDTGSDFSLVRLLPEGSLDSSFANNGRLRLDFNLSYDVMTSLVVQPDGKIILGGISDTPSGSTEDRDFALARVLTNGQPDSTFGQNGKVITPVSSLQEEDYLQKVLLRPDGKITAVGYTLNNGNAEIRSAATIRYQPDGSLDTTFSPSTGILITALGDAPVFSGAITPEGDLLVVGYTLNRFDLDFLVLSLNDAGYLNSDFGNAGVAILPAGNSRDFASACAVLSGNKILVAGSSVSRRSHFGIVQFLENGLKDISFGTEGIQISGAPFATSTARAIAVQADEKFLVAGHSSSNSTTPYQDYYLARFLPDGLPDTSFNAAGNVLKSIGIYNDWCQSMALQPDGKILLAGYANASSTVSDIALARFRPDGQTDNTFGNNGVVVRSVGDRDIIYSMALQDDGKFIVAGSIIDFGNSTKDLLLLRFLPSGLPDPNFGNNGIVKLSIAGGDDEIRAVALQPDGKVLACGYRINSLVSEFALLRFLPSGEIDTGFGNNGLSTTPIGMGAAAHAILLLPDGRIVAGGYAKVNGQDDFAIVCYRPDGTPDPDFGANGVILTDFNNGHDQINALSLDSKGRIIAAGSAEANATTRFALARYLSGLEVGVLDFSTTDYAPFIYPNPIRSEATLEYTLARDETISIRLLDGQGRIVQTFLEGQHQAAGDYQQRIALRETLPEGWYVLEIASNRSQISIRVVKNRK